MYSPVSRPLADLRATPMLMFSFIVRRCGKHDISFGQQFPFQRSGFNEAPQFFGDDSAEDGFVGVSSGFVGFQVFLFDFFFDDWRGLGDFDCVADFERRFFQQTIHVGNQFQHDAAGDVFLVAFRVEFPEQGIFDGAGFAFVEFVIDVFGFSDTVLGWLLLLLHDFFDELLYLGGSDFLVGGVGHRTSEYWRNE
ncbi:hypothetical protein U1Q18_051312 [Sarracenia purpurea var. burkii]